MGGTAHTHTARLLREPQKTRKSPLRLSRKPNSFDNFSKTKQKRQQHIHNESSGTRRRQASRVVKKACAFLMYPSDSLPPAHPRTRAPRTPPVPCYVGGCSLRGTHPPDLTTANPGFFFDRREHSPVRQAEDRPPAPNPSGLSLLHSDHTKTKEKNKKQINNHPLKQTKARPAAVQPRQYRTQHVDKLHFCRARERASTPASTAAERASTAAYPATAGTSTSASVSTAPGPVGS